MPTPSSDTMSNVTTTEPSVEPRSYAPMYSSHGHERKTHLARDGKSLCGVEKQNEHLFFNIGEDYYDIQSQFFVDGPEQHGCLRCRRAWHREQSKSGQQGEEAG